MLTLGAFSFTMWLIGFFVALGLPCLPEDPCQKLLALLAILTICPWVLGDTLRRKTEMAGRFVLTSKVPPPQGRTVMVRSGGSVFSAALRRFSGWALIYGSSETSMPNPPEEWWLDDVLAKEMGLDIDAIEAEPRTLIS